MSAPDEGPRLAVLYLTDEQLTTLRRGLVAILRYTPREERQPVLDLLDLVAATQGDMATGEAP
jgi:hypothetical protein